VEGLHEAGLPDQAIAALQGDFTVYDFTPRENSLLQLADRLTCDPASSAASTRAALASGWTAREVAHAIFVVSYFNMLSRIADAFALPPDATHPYDPEAQLPILRCGGDP
jgi:alkylhydroperoxidase family enzyme